VTIPRKLSKDQRKLLEQLAGTLKESQTSNGDESMVAKLRRLLVG
jgi:DnaJ-class molecular chaperone